MWEPLVIVDVVVVVYTRGQCACATVSKFTVAQARQLINTQV